MRQGAFRTSLASWWPALLLALLWGVLPCLPALLRSELIGQPFTDLYPSVWGLDWFASQQPGFPLHTTEIGWPGGAGFYYSSPLHGWMAWPLLGLGLDLPSTYNLLLLGARVATVLLTFGWLKAEGSSGPGALAGAAVYGCSAFFHGYAVEGIVEGLDGWTLPLWAWILIGAPRTRSLRALLSVPAFCLVVVSSWYLGMAALLVAAVRAPGSPRHALSAALGLLCAIPFWLAFSSAFPEASPLSDEIRAAMGSSLEIPTPGLLPGLQPFAKTSYLGWITTILFLVGARRRPILALGALLSALLSLGVGPWYELPGLEMVRFPYRLIAATLALGALVVAGALAGASRFTWGLGFAIALEALLLSPVEPILPGAPAGLPPVYASVEPTVLLELPGPLAMPPGTINLSRPRARYLLYYKAFHGASSPWRFDFNSVGPSSQQAFLESWVAQDPLCQRAELARLDPTSPCALVGVEPDVQALLRAGVRQVMLHPLELGESTTERISRALQAGGALQVDGDDTSLLFRLPDGP